jgi:hypothetical protein
MVPRKEINWDLVNLAIKAGSTQKEIAESLFLEPDTLRARVKEKYGQEYSVYSASLQSEGKMLLRAAQLQNAVKNGNTQMQIWLGKVLLKQKEPSAFEDAYPNQQNISLFVESANSIENQVTDV